MTNDEIIAAGQQIYDETEVAANTSERVGGVIKGIGQNLADKDTAIAAQAARNGYYQCTVSGTTLAVSAPGFTLPAHGGNIRIKMSAPATGACTLNINSTGPKTLLYNGAAVSSANNWEQDEIITVFYDPSGSGQYLASNCQGGSGQFGSGEKIKDVLLSQVLGAGTDTIMSQKSVSEAIFNEIDISSIDTLKTLDDALAPSSSLKPTYYTVTAMLSSTKLKVGSMAVISDNMRHVVTQIIATHYLLDDAGNLTNEHSDAEIFLIYRSVKLSGGTLPDPAGVWTKWRYVNSSVWGVTAEKVKYNNSQSRLDADNIQEAIDEEVENESILALIFGNHERRIKNNEEHKLGEDDELVLARALQELQGGSGGESSLSGSVTIANSDCIMIIGSSFGAGYTMEGKHWTDIVSMFSDYCFQNVSLSGTSSLDRMNSLLAGTIVPRQNAKYAFVVNSENTSVNQKYLLKEIDNLCKVCLSFGMEPIIGTSYRNYLGNYQENMYVSSLYRDYCEKHNYIFMDAAEQYQLLMKGRYDFNRGGSHIGEREIPVVAYAYMDALHGMERPVKSIKVFMPRESVEDIDNLVFNGTVGRAKRFKEYLMNNYTDSNLTFPLGYALISATIPSEQKNTKIVEFELNPSTDVTVYTRKTNQSPWPTKANLCTRFHIEDEISVPAVNDTYTYNGTTFTVKHVNTQAEDGSYGTFCDIYCTPNLSSSTTTGGTLVRASGSGEASIDFSSYNVNTTYTPDSDLIDAFNGGHWVEVEPNDRGNYSIVNLLGIMDIDRIDFLVKANNGNSFNINSGSIKVNWSASELKTNYRRLPVEKFHCHFVSGGQELLPEPTFGAEGTTQSTWKDGQGNYLVSEANYEKSVKGKSGVYPMDATSIIKVSNSVSMNYTIPASSLPDYGQVEVEVVARNFGTSINSVTVNSWDFNELKLGFGGVTNSGRTYSEMSEQVGLFWKICHFTIDIMYYTGASAKRQLPMKIYAEKSGMEIARVSVKVKN